MIDINVHDYACYYISIIYIISISYSRVILSISQLPAIYVVILVNLSKSC